MLYSATTGQQTTICAVVVLSLVMLLRSADCYEREVNSSEQLFTITTTVALNGAKQRSSGVTCTCVPTHGDEKSSDTGLQPRGITLPPGYQLYGGTSYYKLHRTPEPWPTANKICEEVGGHLVIINSKEEEDVIVELLQDINASNNTLVQVGFHDLINEGQYETVLGEPLDSVGYVNWAADEPYDTFGLTDCGAVDLTGHLKSAFCLAERPFICELPA